MHSIGGCIISNRCWSDRWVCYWLNHCIDSSITIEQGRCPGSNAQCNGDEKRNKGKSSIHGVLFLSVNGFRSITFLRWYTPFDIHNVHDLRFSLVLLSDTRVIQWKERWVGRGIFW